MRKEREWKEYQEKQIKDLEDKVLHKMNDLKEGFVKNVEGFIKVGDFLKDTFKNVKDSIMSGKNDKNKKKWTKNNHVLN